MFCPSGEKKKTNQNLKIQSNLQMQNMLTTGKNVFLYETLQCNKTLPV